MSEEAKTKTESRPSGLQRRQESEGERSKRELRQKIRSIREGHTTGGYCDSEALVVEEKKLHAILSKELDEAKAEHGYSPDPKFKHPTIRTIEVELNGLSYKPRLVVAE